MKRFLPLNIDKAPSWRRNTLHIV